MQEISWGSVPPDSPSWHAYVHMVTSHITQPPHFLFGVSAPVYITSRCMGTINDKYLIVCEVVLILEISYFVLILYTLCNRFYTHNANTLCVIVWFQLGPADVENT